MGKSRTTKRERQRLRRETLKTLEPGTPRWHQLRKKIQQDEERERR